MKDTLTENEVADRIIIAVYREEIQQLRELNAELLRVLKLASGVYLFPRELRTAINDVVAKAEKLRS